MLIQKTNNELGWNVDNSLKIRGHLLIRSGDNHVLL